MFHPIHLPTTVPVALSILLTAALLLAVSGCKSGGGGGSGKPLVIAASSIPGDLLSKVGEAIPQGT